ncbi:MAG: response regulator transcription factor [Microbacteriaceae bacterium]|nr:response regulator transcription factor [Microbacteriaceae bacterium]
MTPSPIRVLLVDDQALIRTGFALILSTARGEPVIEVVGEAEDGIEAIDLIGRLAADDCAPHVVLMDVRMPRMNGIDATRTIVQQQPDIKVLVLTTFDLDEYAAQAIEAGASGFLLKDARAAELTAAVRAVADGDVVMAPSVTRRLITKMRGLPAAHEMSAPGQPDEVRAEPAAPGSAHTAVHPTETDPAAAAAHGQETAKLATLTDREREVFDLIAEGLSNAEIGGRLFLSESTVKTHVGRVLTKLALRDRVHAVILAYETGVR